jgi:general secretion pathway protein G
MMMRNKTKNFYWVQKKSGWASIRNGSGFTLIEILLVVVIILVLAAMVVPNFAGRGEQARLAAARADIEVNLAAALDLYELDNGRYPTTEQGLKALLVKPNSSPVPQNWNGPYLKKKRMPTDPWGQDYVYVSPGQKNTDSYDLSSLGSDGVSSEDDISNWYGETF